MDRLTESSPERTCAPVAVPALEVSGLTYRYPDGHRALHGLDLRVEEGERVAVLGPNGAGKTTMLKMLGTLIAPTAGRASLLGFDIAEQPLEVRRRISMVVQETATDMFLNARDNLLTFARFHGIGNAEARRRATLEFGGVETVKEACRETLGTQFVERLARDLRYAVRALVAAPSFTIVALLVLTLSIGVAAAATLITSTFLPPAFASKSAAWRSVMGTPFLSTADTCIVRLA